MQKKEARRKAKKIRAKENNNLSINKDFIIK